MRALLRRLPGLFLAAVLVLGGAAHAWHHLADPSCDARPGAGSHPCVTCAGLHGAAVAAHAVTIGPPAPLVPAGLFAFATLAPVTPARSAGAARAPPRG